MTLERLFAILRARWLITTSVFVVVFATVAAVTLLMPKTYTATASVVVDIKSPDPIAGTVLTGVASPSYLLTQMDILTSSRVAQKVVSNLNLERIDALHEKWLKSTGGTGEFRAWIADLIRHSLDVKPSRGSNVIYLSYSAPEPSFAATMTNAFLKAYLETSMALRTEPAKQFSDFFDANAKQLRDRVQATQAALSEFQQREGLVVSDERIDVEMTRLNELSSALVQMQNAVADSKSRQNAARTQADQTQEVMNQPLVSSLTADVLRQETQLQQLTTRLGDEHPQVREARMGLEDSKKKLQAEIQKVTASLGVNNHINVGRMDQAREALEAQRAKVLKMKAVRDQAAMLQRDADNAQRAYEGVLARLNMTSLESQAVQNSVAALEYAGVPATPSGPRIGSNLALGALLAFGLALACALLVERHNPYVRTVAELPALAPLAMLGSVPAVNHKKKKTEGEDKLTLRLGLTPSP